MAGITGALLNNLANTPAVSKFLQAQADDDYINRNTSFGSLAGAQEYSNNIMESNKERIPMVIEYPTKSGAVSVTMYINPDKINISKQKIKDKKVTRGGIFYHHWGDDNPTMQLGGNCGLSGMQFIKKLEDIYHASGLLLDYDEAATGPVYTDGNSSVVDQLMSGNWVGAAMSALSGGTKNLGKSLLTGAAVGAMTAITGKSNHKLRTTSVATKTAEFVGGCMTKIGMTDRSKATTSTNSIGIPTVAGGFLGSGTDSKYLQLAGAALQGAVSNLFGSGSAVDDNMSRQRISYDEALSGFQDISDELEDPWRPRQIYIYFEDRCYIGHFDSFNYQRDASTPNIRYDMKFTIIREVIVTSYNPKQPGFVAAQKIVQPMEDLSRLARATSGGGYKKLTSKLETYAKKTSTAISAAKMDILEIKESFTYEKKRAEDNNKKITDAREEQLFSAAKDIRTVAGISDADDLYGNKELTDNQRLIYYAYGNTSNANSSAKALAAADKELQRIKVKTDKLKAANSLTIEEREKDWEWISQIHSAIGRMSYANWEKQLMPA